MRNRGCNPSIHVANVVGDALHEIDPTTAAAEARALLLTSTLQDRVALAPTLIASAHERRCTAYHESGHVMALLVGGAECIEARVRDDGSGHCRGSEIQDPEANITYALAGAFSEIKFHASSIHRFTHPICSDWLIARVWIDDLNASRLWPQRTYRSCAKTAMRFVEARWPQIQALALALNDAGELDDHAIRIFAGRL